MSEVAETTPKTTTTKRATATRTKKPVQEPAQNAKPAGDVSVQAKTVSVSEPAQEPVKKKIQPKTKTGVLTHLMNVRKEPSMDSEAVAMYESGKEVQVTGTVEGDWAIVVCPEAQSGVAYIWTNSGEYVKIE